MFGKKGSVYVGVYQRGGGGGGAAVHSLAPGCSACINSFWPKQDLSQDKSGVYYTWSILDPEAKHALGKMQTNGVYIVNGQDECGKYHGFWRGEMQQYQ